MLAALQHWLVVVEGPGGAGAGSDPPRAGMSRPQETPALWNRFADGKLLFRNLKLLSAVLDRKDRMVQEFWRLLAICHTVMVQEKDGEWPCCPSLQPWAPVTGPGTGPPQASLPLLGLEGIQAQGPSKLCPKQGGEGHLSRQSSAHLISGA